MKNIKWCWLAREVKEGWTLSLEIGNKTTFKAKDTLEGKNKIFKTIKQVEKFANAFMPSEGKIVYVHMKNTKYPIK